MSKKLYALTDREASELRRLVDAAQLRAWAEDDPDGHKDTHYLMARLNTPLDRDTAVERMARATYGPKAWDALDPSDPMGAVHRSAHKAQMRTAFDALLEGDA